MKKLVFFCWLSCLSLIGGAFAQSIGGSVIAVAQQIGNGTSQFIFNSWGDQVTQWAYGTSGNPITTAGPTIKMSRTEQVDPATCNNNAVDNECNATLAVYNVGTSSDGMQTNAIYAGAKSASAKDNVAIQSVGRTQTGGSGIGTGLYLEGRNDSTAGKLIGTEVRANNQSTHSFAYNTSGFSSGSIWATAQSATAANLVGCGMCFGSIASAQYDVGIGFPSQNSVKNSTIRDDGTSITILAGNGTHTYGIDLSGMTMNSGGAAFLAPLTTPLSSSDTCKQGSIGWDASFVYVCAATNTWKRATLNTF